MMFMFHAAFSLSLIALTAGVALYVSSVRAEGPGTGFAKLIGLLVVVLALASTICTGYCGLKLARTGYFSDVMKMHEMQVAGATDEAGDSTVTTKKSKHR